MLQNLFKKSEPTQTPLEELGDRTGDETPHELIYRAYLLGWIHFGTKLAVLNRPGSPVYNAYENWGPLALLAFIGGYYGLMGAWDTAIAVLIGGIFIGFIVLPRYVLKKLRMRVLEKAFGGESGWRELWETGGMTMRLALAPGVICDSPDGDWEYFARTYLDRQDEDGAPSPENDENVARAQAEATGEQPGAAGPGEAEIEEEAGPASARTNRGG